MPLFNRRSRSVSVSVSDKQPLHEKLRWICDRVDTDNTMFTATDNTVLELTSHAGCFSGFSAQSGAAD